MAISLEEIMTQARHRADMERSKFVKDLELIGYINNSAAELYDLITDAYGSDYFVKSEPLSVIAGQASYALPADFYELKGVDLQIDGQSVVNVPRFNFAERNRYSEFGPWQFYRNTNVRYRLVGSNITFSPLPNSDANVTLWYVPLTPKLVNLTDTLNDLNAYSEYIIIDAAIKMMQKQEDDVSVLVAQKSFIIDRIQNKTMNRDAAQPNSVTDIYANGWWGDEYE